MSGPRAIGGDALEPEAAIASWRAYLASRGSIPSGDADELEDHLRTQIDELRTAGLDADEAVLIAIKRMGRQDEIAAEYARENSRRLWKQLVLDGATRRRRLDGGVVVFGFAVLAALLAKLPGLLGAPLTSAVLGGGILALAALGGSIAWRTRPPRGIVAASAVAFAVLFVLAFAYPFSNDGGSDTLIIFGLHVPVILWLVVGLLYAGTAWRTAARRMDFVRFTGEWLVYLALIALGGGVLMGITAAVFSALGADPSLVLIEWVAPCGAAGAAVVAAWLVDSKQEVIENMAPVLGRVFTPLFTAAVLAMLAGACVTGGFGTAGADTAREVLIVVDVLLVVVTGLVLYVVSAQQPTARAGWTERLQLLLVLAAFALNGFALAAMIGRLADGGPTPNRVVALGVNIVLLVGLAGSAWLLGRRTFAGDSSTRRLLAWQTGYLPVYGAWAVLAAVALPPLFAFA